jgi:succinyl-CoA synthetase alpha subunit
MAILVNSNTAVVIQGMTGKEGRRAARAMIEYGTRVCCGVTPRKRGEVVEGRPIFHSVAEAVQAFPEINASAVYVPPSHAKSAMLEAIDAAIPIVNVIVERVPVQDTAYCLAAAAERGVRIIGPSSLGLISPGRGRIGVVGGPIELATEIFCLGAIGVISRSGGMTNEVSWQLRQRGFGQSTAVHIGGDLLVGTGYRDLLPLFEQDKQTTAVVIFGEHGGSEEFDIVELVSTGQFRKPLAVYIGGRFAGSFPEGVTIGHAGAIVEAGKGAKEKERALREAGIMVAEYYEDLVSCIAHMPA